LPLDDLQKHLANRLSNPFINSLVISFAVYNWQCWLYAFTGVLQPAERVELIKVHFSSHPGLHVGCPFLSGVGLLFLLPYLERKIDNYKNWQTLLLKNELAAQVDSVDLTDGKVFAAVAVVVGQVTADLEVVQKYVGSMITQLGGQPQVGYSDAMRKIRNNLNVIERIQGDRNQIKALAIQLRNEKL
jgi:hypothetical protein